MKLWPASLPQYALRAGYNEQPRLPRASFTPASGMPITRPLGTVWHTDIACSFRMTATQLDLFTDFVIRDLSRGSAAFLMPHPRTREQVEVRLGGSGAWQSAPSTGNCWIISVELMVKG